MKGFRAFGQAAWRRGNRWAIKGCSGEGTRGLKVQIQAISECIRTNPQACSMAPSLSVLSMYTCVLTGLCLQLQHLFSVRVQTVAF